MPMLMMSYDDVRAFFFFSFFITIRSTTPFIIFMPDAYSDAAILIYDDAAIARGGDDAQERE